MFIIEVLLQAPNSYYIDIVPEDEPESHEWFISNGQTAVYASVFMEGDEPHVQRRPVDRKSVGFQRIVDFFRMDLVALQQDFRAAVTAVDRKIVAVVEHQVVLEPRRAALREHFNRIIVQLDEHFRTCALIIDDSQGNVIEIEVVSADYETPIPPERFVWPE